MTLQKLFGEMGCLSEKIDDILNSNKFGELREGEVVDAQRNLITDEPNFIFNDKYEILGAQDAEDFKQFKDEILSHRGIVEFSAVVFSGRDGWKVDKKG